MGIQEVQMATRAAAPVVFNPAARWTFKERVQEAEAPLRFRKFLLLPSERVLLRSGEAVEIGSRAFDLLTVLTRSRGKLVTKNEIVKFVWPSTIVEESNLRFQMASLRRVLGEDRDMIKTIPGRGYLFVAEAGAEVSEPIQTERPAETFSTSESFSAEEAGVRILDSALQQAPASSRVAIVVLHGDEGLCDLLASITRSMALHDDEVLEL
jgi:DNA-binding winged helix-turn-helix (wHTH) protein